MLDAAASVKSPRRAPGCLCPPYVVLRADRKTSLHFGCRAATARRKRRRAGAGGLGGKRITGGGGGGGDRGRALTEAVEKGDQEAAKAAERKRERKQREKAKRQELHELRALQAQNMSAADREEQRERELEGYVERMKERNSFALSRQQALQERGGQQRVAIDLAYSGYMTESEARSLASQLASSQFKGVANFFNKLWKRPTYQSWIRMERFPTQRHPQDHQVQHQNVQPPPPPHPPSPPPHVALPAL